MVLSVDRLIVFNETIAVEENLCRAKDLEKVRIFCYYITYQSVLRAIITFKESYQEYFEYSNFISGA